MAIIEAASFGLPIIMTDVGCAGEIIKMKKVELLFQLVIKGVSGGNDKVNSK